MTTDYVAIMNVSIFSKDAVVKVQDFVPARFWVASSFLEWYFANKITLGAVNQEIHVDAAGKPLRNQLTPIERVLGDLESSIVNVTVAFVDTVPEDAVIDEP